ncbi:MAG: tRNA (adenosine(37)-N6)-dimethylallyltransferase MiaA [Acidimicrobiia bacterium]|nr:tRNA (adenosine(37)-N6)-dimethylallyltransferase MiaA [Acidimicrobiia bacterium]
MVGCTASGKSALAMELARARGDVELVSIDSMQVYRGMDIGTAKPTVAEQAEVRHHLIDLADPAEDFTVARFQAAYEIAVADVAARGRVPLLVGGTGLYLQAVLDGLEIPGRYPDVRLEVEAEPDTARLYHRLAGLDPLAAGRMEPTNRRRVVRALEVTLGAGRPFSSFGPGVDAYPERGHRIIGLRRPRPVIDDRIAERYQHQVAAGLLAEVEQLGARPAGMSSTARQALGYKELLAHVEMGAALEECLALANARTRRFARRQERWFRRDPRITWLDVDEKPVVVGDQLLRECQAFVDREGGRV